MDTAATVAPLDDAADRRRRILAIVGGSSGNLVEWYDFYVYSFCALYFAPAFFPSGDRTSQLLAAAGVFAAGFLVRPIGGWVFGRLADRRGRRFAMMASVLLMCAGSLMIAVLPTHASIGILAPILLTVARLAQGLSVGGEYGTSATYMSEVAQPGHRGFYASFQYVTLIGGQLLAVLVIVILRSDAEQREQMRAWGWRIPFVIGAAGRAVVALFLRRALHETQSAEKRAAGRRPASLRALLRPSEAPAAGARPDRRWQPELLCLHHLHAEIPGQYRRAADPHGQRHHGLRAVRLHGAAAGLRRASSDRVGRRTMLLAFGGLGALMTVPLLSALSHIGSPVMAGLLVLGALAVISCYTSISGLVKAELFPGEVRALGVGLPYAVANALFGGTAEYVGLWFKSVGAESGFFWYVTGFFVLALVTAFLMPETRIESHLAREHGAGHR